jgi:magnesium transporter
MHSKIPQHIQSIKKKDLTWFEVTKPTRTSLAFIQRKFGIHDLDVANCLSPEAEPKVTNYRHYLFMVLIFPVFDRGTRTVHASEVDFFVTKRSIAVIHRNEISSFHEFTQNFIKRYLLTKSNQAINPSSLLYHLLEKLYLYTFPMLEHVNRDVRGIEKRIFSGYEREVVREILHIKRNIVHFRKSMQLHKGMLRRLLIRGEKIFPVSKDKIYYENLIEYTKDIWDTLEIQKEDIDALHLTNESLISFRLNDIMKFLTMISVVILPGSVIAGIFGMNVPTMPVVGEKYGFFIVLGIMSMVSLTLIFFFRNKKWL